MDNQLPQQSGASSSSWIGVIDTKRIGPYISGIYSVKPPLVKLIV
jgi:hypothetical protein